jgi:hypothetical protein
MSDKFWSYIVNASFVQWCCNTPCTLTGIENEIITEVNINHSIPQTNDEYVMLSDYDFGIVEEEYEQYFSDHIDDEIERAIALNKPVVALEPSNAIPDFLLKVQTLETVNCFVNSILSKPLKFEIPANPPIKPIVIEVDKIIEPEPFIKDNGVPKPTKPYSSKIEFSESGEEFVVFDAEYSEFYYETATGILYKIVDCDGWEYYYNVDGKQYDNEQVQANKSVDSLADQEEDVIPEEHFLIDDDDDDEINFVPKGVYIELIDNKKEFVVPAIVPQLSIIVEEEPIEQPIEQQQTVMQQFEIDANHKAVISFLDGLLKPKQNLIVVEQSNIIEQAPKQVDKPLPAPEIIINPAELIKPSPDRIQVFNYPNENIFPKSFDGTKQFKVEDVNKLLNTYLEDESANRNPHKYSAAYRKLHYSIVNDIYKGKYLKDIFGNARSGKLLNLCKVHIQRSIVTLKDVERLALIKKNKIEMVHKGHYPKPNIGSPIACTHEFDKCYCATDADFMFLNDVYQAYIFHQLKTWVDTKKTPIIVIMKVFDVQYFGGRIIVSHNGLLHDQGCWYRIQKDNSIVFSPNTENTDTERHYVHIDMLANLYKNNYTVEYGYEFNVLHRDYFGAGATIIACAKPTTKPNKSLIFDLQQQHGTRYYNGGEEELVVARAQYYNNTIPEQSTQLYTVDGYNASLIKRSNNIMVDDFKPLLDQHANAHIHFCTTCTLPYLHVHMLGKNSKDAGSANAKHVQFDFDCPYKTCKNYNHVDCVENCSIINHKAARNTLMKYVKKTWYLNPDEVNKVITEFQSAAKNNLQPSLPKATTNNIPVVKVVVPVVNQSPIEHVINAPFESKSELFERQLEKEGLPILRANIDNESVVDDRFYHKELEQHRQPAKDNRVNGALPYNSAMNSNFTVLEPGMHYEQNPITKLMEVTLTIDETSGPKLTAFSTVNTGIVEFNYASECFTIPAKALNRMILAGTTCVNVRECSTYVNRAFTNASQHVITPQMLNALKQFVYREIITRTALDAHLTTSVLGGFLMDALESKLKPYHGFWRALYKYGLKQAVGLWCTERNFCNCNAGIVDVGELNLLTPDRGRRD